MGRRIPAALLTIACILPFIRLGLGEIQPWDESLYVIRAESCLKFGAWLDQTKYAVGGLYSATHPPFGVWLIAISKFLLGDSTFAIRLPIAVAASVSVALLWMILRKFSSKEAALVASVSLSTADLFLFFSHRAQMECMVLCFSLASIYFLLIALDRDSWKFAALAGVILGFGLLTKFAEALFVLPFILLLPRALGKLRTIRYVVAVFVVALVVVAPWFVMMTLRHPDYWNHVYGSLETLREGNYAPSTLAWWYYLNRLLVGLPLIVAAVFITRVGRPIRASIGWILSLLVVLQLVGTRMPHFAFLLLAPGAVLIGFIWDLLKNRTTLADLSGQSNKSHYALSAFFFTVLLLVIAYSSSEQVRLLFTHRIRWREFITVPQGLVAFGIAVTLGIAATMSSENHARISVGFSVLLLSLAFLHLFSTQEHVYQDGAESVASIATLLPEKSSILVIHPNFPNEKYAPQLAYYTHGWTLGWIPGKTSRTMTWDSSVSLECTADSARELAVITRFEDRFFHPPVSEIALWDSLTKKLHRCFSHEKVYRSYVLYY